MLKDMAHAFVASTLSLNPGWTLRDTNTFVTIEMVLSQSGLVCEPAQRNSSPLVRDKIIKKGA
jgi:hypothetical protein